VLHAAASLRTAGQHCIGAPDNAAYFQACFQGASTCPKGYIRLGAVHNAQAVLAQRVALVHMSQNGQVSHVHDVPALLTPCSRKKTALYSGHSYKGVTCVTR
jgi:hypothetical protein